MSKGTTGCLNLRLLLVLKSSAQGVGVKLRIFDSFLLLQSLQNFDEDFLNCLS